MPLPAAQVRPSAPDLMALPRKLWAAKLWIVSAAILGIIPGLLVGAVLPVRYNASTQVLIDPVDLQVVDKGLKAANPFGDIQIAQVETQSRVLTSQNVLRPVIERLGLTRDPEFARAQPASSMMGKLRALIPIPQPPAVEENLPAEALRALQKKIAVRRAERTFILDVTVSTTDPDKSVTLANAIVDSFLDERAQSLTEAARRAAGSLTERVAEMKQRVESAERAVVEFKRSNDTVASGGSLVTEQQLTTLSQQLVMFRVTAAEAKARFEQMQLLRANGGDPGSLPAAIQSQALASLKAQYGDARGKEGLLSAQLMPGHPSVVAARGQLNSIRVAIREEVNRIAANAEGEFDRTRRQEAALESQVEQLRREITDTNDRLLRLRELERDAQAQRSVYESFLLRTREIGAQEKLDVVNARIISRAEQADRAPWPPRLWQVVAATMILAAALAAALAASKRA